jgi:hypothetical protein
MRRRMTAAAAVFERPAYARVYQLFSFTFHFNTHKLSIAPRGERSHSFSFRLFLSSHFRLLSFLSFCTCKISRSHRLNDCRLHVAARRPDRLLYSHCWFQPETLQGKQGKEI